MIKNLFSFILIVYLLKLAEAQQAAKKLGEECIPGTCLTINSKCKWQGSSFKCVCKEKFIVVNETHCGRHLNNLEEQKCKDCLERDSLCLDFDNDDKTDHCYCPKNESCGVVPKSKQILKALKAVEVNMILLDVNNNRPILDGSTIYAGDQVLIDLKATVKDPSILMSIENCSISALTKADDIFKEKIDLVKKGCPVHNELLPFNIDFRSISDTHMESNVFEIFKLRSSSIVLLNCWIQFCASKSKCPQKICNEASIIINSNQESSLTRLQGDQDTETIIWKDTGIRFLVEDPLGIQDINAQNGLRKDSSQLSSNLIELEIKSKPFTGLVKTALVSTIAIVFAIIISLLSILIYRTCTREQYMHTGPIETPVSICQPSEECKYDMNAQNFDESFFQSPGIEPISTQSRGSRW